MFFAVILFVVLLLGLLYIAFMRFGDPPPPSEAAPVTWSVPPAASMPPSPANFRGANGAEAAPVRTEVHGGTAVAGSIRVV